MKARGITAGEWLALLIAVPLVLALVLTVCSGRIGRCVEEARPIRCRNNLAALGKGMAAYLQDFGNGWAYPCPLGLVPRPNDYNGAEWLASLYWTGVLPDPGVFICPCSPDSNNNGMDLGDTRESLYFSSGSVSYAGLHHYSYRTWAVRGLPMAIRAQDYRPSDPMASDDTQASINHGERTNGGMSILFWDAHVEFKTDSEIDLERAVGQKGGLLEKLRN